MTLLRDLIPIPERVHQSDFVLRRTEGLAHAERTLDDSVVTEQLVHCFDDALGVIQKAVATGISKAVYLHGSFGSGKSHFMAVLSLLLAGNPRARSIVELAPVVARHNGWTEGRRFLLVPYHMIGSNDLESAILGGYADHVRRSHPQAPIPGYYLAEHLFRDADAMRARMGDEAFLGALNETAGGRSRAGADWPEAGRPTAMSRPGSRPWTATSGLAWCAISSRPSSAPTRRRWCRGSPSCRWTRPWQCSPSTPGTWATMR